MSHLRRLLRSLRYPLTTMSLLIGTGAHATDIYNASTRQLVAPAIVVGSATLANVSVQVQQIVTPPGGTSPNGTEDTYDPVTGYLTVPAVQVGTHTYFNPVVTVTGPVSIGSASGVDTFDGTHLAIPTVQVGAKSYKNVVLAVTLANVAKVNGGLPTATSDSFDPATGRLAIAAVQVGATVYTNVLLNVTLANVVSVGGIPSLATFAGRPGGIGYWDDTGTLARFSRQTGVVVDSHGNTFVADDGNRVIRKITPAGAVSTFAGKVVPFPQVGVGSSLDGIGTAAAFQGFGGIAIDSSDTLYVLDVLLGASIRRITSAGVVTTLAGSFTDTGSADGGPTVSRFNGPQGIAVDGKGNVYVTDTGNQTIRKVTSAGVVSTIAGKAGLAGNIDAAGSLARFNTPTGIAVNANGVLYVTDTFNATIRQIAVDGTVTTLAGGGIAPGSAGSGDGQGTAAGFLQPTGVTLDASGNLNVCDGSAIRRVTPGGAVTTIAGTNVLTDGLTKITANEAGTVDGPASSARFFYPTAIAVSTVGGLVISDYGADTIRVLDPGGTVTTLAGQPQGGPGSVTLVADGSGTSARFGVVGGMARDAAGNLYVVDGTNAADTATPSIRKVSPDGIVSTFLIADAVTGEKVLGPRGPGVGAIAIDSGGNLYVAGKTSIQKVTPAGQVIDWAGTTTSTGNRDGMGTAASFSDIYAMAFDGSGNLYVGDFNRVRKITATVVVTTIAGSSIGFRDGPGTAAQFSAIHGLTVDAQGTVYVTDACSVRKVSAAGQVTTVAGGNLSAPFSACGTQDGLGTDARFANPAGLYTDSGGNIFIADSGNGAIRKLAPSGSVTTVVGTVVPVATASGSVNRDHVVQVNGGNRLNYPTSVLPVDAKTLLILDGSESIIVKATLP